MQIMTRDTNKKINLGQYNTVKNLWLRSHIIDFIKNTGCKNGFDPFAGKGNIIEVIKDLGLSAYATDIDSLLNWKINDSLVSVPYYDNTLIITNPCFLAKNSAKRMTLDSYKYFYNNSYSDLYQIALEKLLLVYDNIIAIIPETFLLSGLFKSRIHSITVIEENLFTDTECPVCVACFKKQSNTTDIYKNDKKLFDIEYLENKIKDMTSVKEKFDIKFNDKRGCIGLRAIDGVKKNDRICFCLPEKLNYDLNKITNSSRAISVISFKPKININKLIINCNTLLEKFRSDTHDLALSPFKNNNNEGNRRRRLDFKLARALINNGVKKYV